MRGGPSGGWHICNIQDHERGGGQVGQEKVDREKNTEENG